LAAELEFIEAEFEGKLMRSVKYFVELLRSKEFMSYYLRFRFDSLEKIGPNLETINAESADCQFKPKMSLFKVSPPNIQRVFVVPNDKESISTDARCVLRLDDVEKLPGFREEDNCICSRRILS
jgi:hypothetical protein